MSDTPDTDALDQELHSPCVLQDRYSEMRDHARRLERERDEWYYKAHANAAFTLEARRERDEAREALDCLLAVIGLTPIAGNKHALQDAVDYGLAVLRKQQEAAK